MPNLVEFGPVILKKYLKMLTIYWKQTDRSQTDRRQTKSDQKKSALCLSAQVSIKAFSSAPDTCVEPGLGTPVADLRVPEKDAVSLDRPVNATEKHGDQEREQRNRFPSFNPQRENKRPGSSNNTNRQSVHVLIIVIYSLLQRTFTM